MRDRPPPTSTYGRILAAALAGFAQDGVSDTTIRSVAAAAGVSPGLVQHYFASKGALCAAVNDHVTELAHLALGVREVEGDIIEELSDRLTAFVADHFVALRYVARGVAERDEAAMAIFDTIVDLCRVQLAQLHQDNMLREGIDLEWAALHTVLLNLATVIFEPGVSRQLGRPFRSKRQIQRWQHATTDLFVSGEIRRRDM